MCLTKSSSEMLQNLPYFIYTKTQSCFFSFSFRPTLFFCLIYALVYVDFRQIRTFIRQKNKVTRNEKRNATLGFHTYKIWHILRISLELFVEHKPWNWEEWSNVMRTKISKIENCAFRWFHLNEHLIMTAFLHDLGPNHLLHWRFCI